MNEKNFFRKITSLISVPKCVCCGEKLGLNDVAFCNNCRKSFDEDLKRDCSLCTKRLSECSCVPEYLKNHFVKKLFKVFRYKRDHSASSSLIYSIKKQARYDTVNLAAALIAESIKNNGGLPDNNTIITNVPRRPSAIRKFGHDHSALIAKRVSKIMKVKYKRLLKSKAKLEQKNLIREDRMKNAKVFPRWNYNLSNKTVLIVDDIVTSGASMAVSASMIRSLGCKQIYCASLGIAYRDVL